MPHSQPPAFRRTAPPSSSQQSDRGVAQGPDRLLIATICGHTFRVLSLDLAQNRVEVRPTTEMEHELFLIQHAANLRNDYRRGDARDSQTAAEVILMQMALQPSSLLPVTDVGALPQPVFPPMEDGAVFIPGPAHGPDQFQPQQDPQPMPGQRPARPFNRRPRIDSLVEATEPSSDEETAPQTSAPGAPPPPPPSTGPSRLPADSYGQQSIVMQIVFSLHYAVEHNTPFQAPPGTTLEDLREALFIVQRDTTLIAYQRHHMELLLLGVIEARTGQTPTTSPTPPEELGHPHSTGTGSPTDTTGQPTETPQENLGHPQTEGLPESPTSGMGHPSSPDPEIGHPESSEIGHPESVLPQTSPAPQVDPNFALIDELVLQAVTSGIPLVLPPDIPIDSLITYRTAMLAGETSLSPSHPKYPDILRRINRQIMSALISVSMWEAYETGQPFVPPADATPRDLRRYVLDVRQDMRQGEQPSGITQDALDDILNQCLQLADQMDPPPPAEPVAPPQPSPQPLPEQPPEQQLPSIASTISIPGDAGDLATMRAINGAALTCGEQLTPFVCPPRVTSEQLYRFYEAARVQWPDAVGLSTPQREHALTEVRQAAQTLLAQEVDRTEESQQTTVTPGAPPPPPPPSSDIDELPEDGRTLTPMEQLQAAMVEAVFTRTALRIPSEANNIPTLRTAIDQLQSGELSITGASRGDIRRIRKELKIALITLETEAIPNSQEVMSRLRDAVADVFDGQPFVMPEGVEAAHVLTMVDRLIHGMETTTGRSDDEVRRVCTALMDALQPASPAPSPDADTDRRMAICQAAITAVTTGVFTPPAGVTAADLQLFLDQAASPEVLAIIRDQGITSSEWQNVLALVGHAQFALENVRPLGNNGSQLEDAFLDALNTGRLVWPTQTPSAIACAQLHYSLEHGYITLPEGYSQANYDRAMAQLGASAGYLARPLSEPQAQDDDLVFAFRNALVHPENRFIAPAWVRGSAIQAFVASYNRGEEPQPTFIDAEGVSSALANMQSAGEALTRQPLAVPERVRAAFALGIPPENLSPITDEMRVDLVVAALAASSTPFQLPAHISQDHLVLWLDEVRQLEVMGVRDLLNSYIDQHEIRDDFRPEQLAQFRGDDLVRGLREADRYLDQTIGSQWINTIAPALVGDNQNLPAAQHNLLTTIARDALRSITVNPFLFTPSQPYTPQQLKQFVQLMRQRDRIIAPYLSPRISSTEWDYMMDAIERAAQDQQPPAPADTSSDDDDLSPAPSEPGSPTEPVAPTVPQPSTPALTPEEQEYNAQMQALVLAIEQALATGMPGEYPASLTADQLRSYRDVLITALPENPNWQRIIDELNQQIVTRAIAEAARLALETGVFVPPPEASKEDLLQFVRDMRRDLSLGEQLDPSVESAQLMRVLTLIRRAAMGITLPSREDSVFEPYPEQSSPAPVSPAPEAKPPEPETKPLRPAPQSPAPKPTLEPEPESELSPPPVVPTQPEQGAGQVTEPNTTGRPLTQHQAFGALNRALMNEGVPFVPPEGVTARQIRAFLLHIMDGRSRRSDEVAALPARYRPPSVSNPAFVEYVMMPLTAAADALETGGAAGGAPATTPPAIPQEQQLPSGTGTPENTEISTPTPPPATAPETPSPLADPRMSAIVQAILAMPQTGDFVPPAGVTTTEINLFILQVWEKGVHIPGTEHLDRSAVSAALRRQRRLSASEEMDEDPIARAIIEAIVRGRASREFVAPEGVSAQQLRDFLSDILHQHPRADWVTALLDLGAGDFRASRTVIEISGLVRAEANRMEEEAQKPPKRPAPKRPPPPPPPAGPAPTKAPADGAPPPSLMEQLAGAIEQALHTGQPFVVPAGITTTDLRTIYSAIAAGQALPALNAAQRARALQMLDRAITTSIIDDAVGRFVATGNFQLPDDIAMEELESYRDQWLQVRAGQVVPGSDDERVAQQLGAVIHHMRIAALNLSPAENAVFGAILETLETGDFQIPAGVTSLQLRQFVVDSMSNPERINLVLGRHLDTQQRSALHNMLVAAADILDRQNTPQTPLSPAPEPTPAPEVVPEPEPTPEPELEQVLPSTSMDPAIPTETPAPMEPATSSLRIALAQALADGTEFVVPLDATTAEISVLLGEILTGTNIEPSASNPRRLEIVQTLYDTLTTAQISDACAGIGVNGCFVPPADVSAAELIQYMGDVIADLEGSDPDDNLRGILLAMEQAITAMVLTQEELEALASLNIPGTTVSPPAPPPPPPPGPDIATNEPADGTGQINPMESILAALQAALEENTALVVPPDVTLNDLLAFQHALVTNTISTYPAHHRQREEIEDLLDSAISSVLICDAMVAFTQTGQFIVPEGVTARDLRDYLDDMEHDQIIGQGAPDAGLAQALEQVRQAAVAMEAAEEAVTRLQAQQAAWNRLSPTMQALHQAAFASISTGHFEMPAGATIEQLQQLITQLEQHGIAFNLIPGIDLSFEELDQIRAMAVSTLEEMQQADQEAEIASQRWAAWGELTPNMQAIHQAARDSIAWDAFTLPRGVNVEELGEFIVNLEADISGQIIMPDFDPTPAQRDRILGLARAAEQALKELLAEAEGTLPPPVPDTSLPEETSTARLDAWNALNLPMQEIHRAARASVTSGHFTAPENATIDELEEFHANLQVDLSGQMIAPDFDPSAEERETILRLVAQTIAAMKQAEEEAEEEPLPAPPSGPSAPPPPPPPAGGAAGVPSDGTSQLDPVLEALKQAFDEAMANDTEFVVPEGLTIPQLRALRNYILTRKDSFPSGDARCAFILRQINSKQGRLLIAEALAAAEGNLATFDVPLFVSTADLLDYINGIRQQLGDGITQSAQLIINTLRRAAEETAGRNRLWADLDATMRSLHWRAYDSLTTGEFTLPAGADISHIRAFIDAQRHDPLGFMIVAGWIPTPDQRAAILAAVRRALAALEAQAEEQLPPPSPMAPASPTTVEPTSPLSPPPVVPQQSLRDRLLEALRNNTPFTVPEGTGIPEIQDLIAELDQPSPAPSLRPAPGELSASERQRATIILLLRRTIHVSISAQIRVSTSTGAFVPPTGVSPADLLRYIRTVFAELGAEGVSPQFRSALDDVRASAESLANTLPAWAGLSTTARALRWAAHNSLDSSEFVVPEGATSAELEALIQALNADPDGASVMPGGALTTTEKSALMMRLRRALRELKAKEAENLPKEPAGPKPDDGAAGAGATAGSGNAPADEEDFFPPPPTPVTATPGMTSPWGPSSMTLPRPDSSHPKDDGSGNTASLPRFQKGTPKEWPSDDGTGIHVTRRDVGKGVFGKIKRMIPDVKSFTDYLSSKDKKDKKDEKSKDAPHKKEKPTPPPVAPKPCIPTSGGVSPTRPRPVPQPRGPKPSLPDRISLGASRRPVAESVKQRPRRDDRRDSSGSYDVTTDSGASESNNAENKDKS